jgi:O-antigen/teichoic acid export membrane protein
VRAGDRFRSLRDSGFPGLEWRAIDSLDKMAAIGVAQGLNFLVIAAGIGLVYVRALGLSVLLTWLLAGQVVEMFVSSFCLMRVGVRPGHFSMSGWWPLLRNSTPVGLTYTVGTLILRSDVIILALFVPTATVGHFAAADMGLVMVYVMAWLFGGVVLAEMARRSHDPVALQRYCRRWVSLLLSTTIPACLLLAVVSPRLVPIFYGTDYAPAGLIAGVMALSIPLILLNAVYLSRAIATGSVRIYLSTYIGVGVLTIGLNLGLGRYYGALGVCVAIVIRELTMLTAFIAMGISRAARRTNEPGMAVPGESLGTIDA